jgi:hypothetical protein
MNHGPGPIIHGHDITDPTRFIVQLPDGSIGKLTATDIANIPIRHQWFTGTSNGLIASWPDRDHAEKVVEGRGVLLGQIKPVTINAVLGREFAENDWLVMLTDQHGNPLRGEPS